MAGGLQTGRAKSRRNMAAGPLSGIRVFPFRDARFAAGKTAVYRPGCKCKEEKMTQYKEKMTENRCIPILDVIPSVSCRPSGECPRCLDVRMIADGQGQIPQEDGGGASCQQLRVLPMRSACFAAGKTAVYRHRCKRRGRKMTQYKEK